jgi:hypothetical protein
MVNMMRRILKRRANRIPLLQSQTHHLHKRLLRPMLDLLSIKTRHVLLGQRRVNAPEMRSTCRSIVGRVVQPRPKLTQLRLLRL